MKGYQHVNIDEDRESIICDCRLQDVDVLDRFQIAMAVIRTPGLPIEAVYAYAKESASDLCTQIIDAGRLGDMTKPEAGG